MVACETLTVAVPVFVIVSDWVVLLPTATSPKLRVVVLAESTPEPDVTGVPGPVFAALVYPAQLDRPTIAKNVAITVSSRAGRDHFVLWTLWVRANVAAVVSWVLEWFLMSRSV
jgi:hypothetical protein